jgi:hypothetical protein
MSAHFGINGISVVDDVENMWSLAMFGEKLAFELDLIPTDAKLGFLEFFWRLKGIIGGEIREIVVLFVIFIDPAVLNLVHNLV